MADSQDSEDTDQIAFIGQINSEVPDQTALLGLFSFRENQTV